MLIAVINEGKTTILELSYLATTRPPARVIHVVYNKLSHYISISFSMPLFTISFRLPIKLTSTPLHPSEPTLLESVSRRVRTYVPSAIPISAARPTPPRVSRPVSFGTISSSTSSSNRKRRGSDVSSVDQGGMLDDDGVFPTDGDELGGAPRGEGRGLIKYPRSEDVDGEEIVWARWDSLGDGSQSL
jgi:hypothetical protein